MAHLRSRTQSRRGAPAISECAPSAPLSPCYHIGFLEARGTPCGSTCFCRIIQSNAAAPQRSMRSADLVAMLTDARQRTLALVADLTDEQMRVPRMDIINPLVCEIGQLAWFQEKWSMRHLCDLEHMRPVPDHYWDSAQLTYAA